MDFQKSFESFIHQQKLFHKKDRILLAVSGGVDSVVMAELFHRSGFSFGLAHCNFQLRGKESDADEEFTEALADRYNVPFHSVRFETKTVARETKHSLQETARDLRYQWFSEIQKAFEYRAVATGHHLNDSIETFFINLLRGTGIAGLTGIRPSTESGIVRPLIFATRKQVEAFAETEGIRFRQDTSNDADDYLRNRIRHHLLPLLVSLNPEFESVMERNLHNLAFASTVFHESIRKKFSGIAKGNTETAYDLKKLLKEKDPASLLAEFLLPFGFHASQAEAILSASQPGKAFHTTRHSLFLDRGKVILKEKEEGDLKTYRISKTAETFGHPHFTLLLKRSTRTPGLSIPGDPHMHLFDLTKMKGPLTIRAWRPGDRFTPLGMKGTRKVSDFLTDRKISLPDKAKTYVLLSGKQIVCILGERIDNRVRITEKTKKILWIEYKKK